MSQYRKTTINLPEGEITLETGKLASLAAGSVMVTMGGTSLFATATVEDTESEQDFFPLSVEYVERMYASGSISSSKYLKREGSPSDSAVTKARQVDHSIRPLFPKGFRKPVLVVLTVMAYDGIHNPESLTVFAASIAVLLSGVPFAGPASSTVIAVDKSGALHVNPSLKHSEDDMLGEFAISGITGKALNFEGWGKELSDEQMDQIMDAAMERIKILNDAQTEFVTGLTKPAMSYSELPVNEEVLNYVMDNMKQKIKDAIYLFDREENGRQMALAAIREQVATQFVKEGSDVTAFDVEMAVDYAGKKIMREGVIKEGKRLSGRAFDEIRPLSAEIDVLPTVHGSALFNRGLTQSLSIVTLGASKLNQVLEDVSGEFQKPFMHHYNMPSFSTGEAKKFQYRPGRREIGHGVIGENALRHIVPSQEEFPYTIRVVSEIMSSNGSTSMAATCASSLALMAAGVPMKGAVAGIGVGLITDSENEDNYKLMLDIEGVEDFWGDMDFKVTGTSKGMTAIQFETKLKGVSPEILKQAFRLAHKGRLQVLEVMNNVIANSRADVAENAPRVEVVTIPVDSIGELIGPGGKNIKALIEAGEELVPGSKLDVEIQQDGKVLISSANKQQRDFVMSRISMMTMQPEVGQIYEGIVDKVMPYGAFVDVTQNISGLVHISEMGEGFVKDPNDVVKEGQVVKVKLIKIEHGKLSFSMKLGTKQDKSNSEQVSESAQ